MDSHNYLDIIKHALFTGAKIRSGTAFSVGTTPSSAGAKIGDINEIDLAFTPTDVKVKCFYDNITKSNNSSPFYYNISFDEIDLWVKGCKEFKQTGSLFDNKSLEKYKNTTEEKEKKQW